MRLIVIVCFLSLNSSDKTKNLFEKKNVLFKKQYNIIDFILIIDSSV